MELFEMAASLGVGCFLAVLIFIMYRIDRKNSEKRFTILLDRVLVQGEKNTRAFTKLITLLRRVNGKLKEK